MTAHDIIATTGARRYVGFGRLLTLTVLTLAMVGCGTTSGETDPAVVAESNAASDSTPQPQPEGPPTTIQGYEMVRIEPGEFWMGSPEDEPKRDADEIRHQVELTAPYSLGTTEVTQELWKHVMGSTGSRRKYGERRPVSVDSWCAAILFCNRLSVAEGLDEPYRIPPGFEDGMVLSQCEAKSVLVEWNRESNGYRLPTEAEWEYAARAGAAYLYAGSDSLGDVGWYYVNAVQVHQEVATKQANDWGLYDMSGNASEWVWDRYGDYPKGTVTDPVGQSIGTERVLRGGSSGNNAVYCRCAWRGHSTPGDPSVGIRLARSVMP